MQDSSSLPSAPEGALLALQELPRQIERMHRRFLDVVRLELGRQGVHDLSPVQVMMMANIGGEEVAVRDLIERGYYLGSNASYNLKQIVEGGYVDRRDDDRDKRSSRLSLTPKGKDVLDKLASLEGKWAAGLLREDGGRALELTFSTLRALERCWSDAVR